MKIVQLTPDVRQLANQYQLLLGLTNELDMILTLGDSSPEQRLQEISELVAFVRQHTQNIPMIFRAERADDPELQAMMIEPWDQDTMYQKVNSAGQPLGEPYHIPRVVQAPEQDHPGYILGADGEFHEAEPDEDLQPLTDKDLIALGLLNRKQIQSLLED